MRRTHVSATFELEPQGTQVIVRGEDFTRTMGWDGLGDYLRGVGAANDIYRRCGLPVIAVVPRSDRTGYR